MIFEIHNLSASADGKEIIRNVSLAIGEGEIHAIMGPNGSGKSTLCYAIMGHPKYKVSGSAKIDGKEITALTADKRAKLGLFLAFQNPQEIGGVNVVNVLRRATISDENRKDIGALMKLNENVAENARGAGLAEEMIKRDLNIGFSGGEKKRMEMVQLRTLNPKIAILDEIDSGLDVDGVKRIADAIAEQRKTNPKTAFLIITHLPRILKFVKPDAVHIMVGGRMVKEGGPELANEIERTGYEKMKAKTTAKKGQ